MEYDREVVAIDQNQKECWKFPKQSSSYEISRLNARLQYALASHQNLGGLVELKLNSKHFAIEEVLMKICNRDVFSDNQKENWR